MTSGTKSVRIRPVLPAAAIAALLLAGCSTGHIGESWQCPLAEGGLCDSVAAADPAVPDPDAAGATVLAEPLWRVRAAETGTFTETACPADCEGGFDPFAWLARLFAVEAHEGDARSPAAPVEPDAALAAEAGASPGAPHGTQPRPAAATAPLAGEPEAVERDPARGDLRTGEILARIWIAPFVDAEGVYREASHVRVVLEPAGWRLP